MPQNPDEWSASFRWVARSFWPLGVDGFQTGRTTTIHWVHGSCTGVCESCCKCGWGKKKEISHGGRHDWGEKNLGSPSPSSYAVKEMHVLVNPSLLMTGCIWWTAEMCFLCPNSHSLKAGFENCISNRRGFFCYWKKCIKHKSMKYMCLA